VRVACCAAFDRDLPGSVPSGLRGAQGRPEGHGIGRMIGRLLVSLLVLGLLAAPLAAEAQQAGKVVRVGVLTLATPTSPEVQTLYGIFLRGMRDLGWVEGRNMAIEARHVAGRRELLPEAAAELVRLGVDVIVAWTPAGVAAAKEVTSTIPIVGLSMGDPVRTGLVTSLARPGGNVTGVANLRPALTGKWLELLKAIVPGITRVAVLANPADLESEDYVREVSVATRSWKAEVKFFNVGKPQDFESIFADMSKWRAGGLLVVPDVMFWLHRAAIVKLAVRSRLPAVYWSREYADLGGLVSYAPSLDDMARRAPVFVDKILKGAKPADLPVEQPTKFELIINLKTAKALGLTIPQSLLLRADHLIE
jgi:putative ABC transport system substrate-binding protein